MADPRFFPPPNARSLAEIIAHLSEAHEIDCAAGTDLSIEINSLASLEEASDGDISFIDNPAYLDRFRMTGASACLVSSQHQKDGPGGCAMLITPEPYRAYARLARYLFPEPPVSAVISSTASIHQTAQLGDGVAIGPHAHLSAGVQIGAGTVIGAGVSIGENVSVGRNCRISTQASLSHCLLGDRVVIHSGARIGQEGFGFALGAEGGEKVPQLGRVILQDEVEIGANSCVDRGSIPDTVIGDGTKIDNLVQIGHNVRIGRHCFLAGQSAIAGSTILEDFVLVGGHSCIAGHLRIGERARISGGAAVMRDIPVGESHGGVPAREMKSMLRETIVLEKLAKKRGRGS